MLDFRLPIVEFAYLAVLARDLLDVFQAGFNIQLAVSLNFSQAIKSHSDLNGDLLHCHEMHPTGQVVAKILR